MMKKYELQRQLYLKLAQGTNMATEYNTQLLARIWALTAEQLKKELK